MDPLATRQLGRTDVRVTQLGLGGASIGSLFVRVPEEDALATVRQGWDEGMRLFDTAPWYGRGLSELRTGAGLRDLPRDEYVLSTKVGRWLQAAGRSRDYDPCAVGRWQPVRGRLRLHLRRDHALVRAEPPAARRRRRTTSRSSTTSTSVSRATEPAGRRVRDPAARRRLAGARRAQAVGAHPGHRRRDQRDGHAPALAGSRGPRLLPRRDALHAARPGGARRRVPGLAERGIGFVIGAVFQSGILATGPSRVPRTRTAPASAEIKDKTARIAGRLRAPRRAPRGRRAPVPARSPAGRGGHPGRVRPSTSGATWRRSGTDIPADLWAELKHEGLLHPEAPVPG